MFVSFTFTLNAGPVPRFSTFTTQLTVSHLAASMTLGSLVIFRTPELIRIESELKVVAVPVLDFPLTTRRFPDGAPQPAVRLN